MVFVVKICWGKDIRRKRFGDAAEVSFEAIKAIVKENFDLDAFVARYSDDEGDLCSLSAMTLPDALELSRGTLRLEIEPVLEKNGPLALSQLFDASAAPAREELPEHIDSFVIHTPPGRSPRFAGSGGPQADWQLLDTDSIADGANLAETEAALPSDPSQATEETTEAVSARVSHEEMPASASDVRPDPAQPEVVVDEQASATDEAFPPEPSQGDTPEHHALARETQEAATSTKPPTEEVEDQQDGTQGGSITDAEKVLLVVAAFDADGDGRLSFREMNELQQAAWGGCIEHEAFDALCMELVVDADLGLGSVELTSFYERYGTLDRDFNVSLVRLQGGSHELGSPEPGNADATDASRSDSAAPSFCRGPGALLLPLLAVPLVFEAPVLGVPLAIIAAKRCYQRR